MEELLKFLGVGSHESGAKEYIYVFSMWYAE